MELFLSIGTRLREERERLGKTQTELAEMAAAADVPGATRQSQARYEKGLQMPGAAYLAVVATAGVDIQYVITGVPSAQRGIALSAEETALLGNFRNCSTEGRAAILATATAMASAAAPPQGKVAKIQNFQSEVGQQVVGTQIVTQPMTFSFGDKKK